MRHTFIVTFVLCALCACATATAAQDKLAPYAGQEQRPLKALAPEEVAELRAGHGMGLAKAAELNHYPGPRHVLDLATQLELTPMQRNTAQAIYERMHARAVELGAQVISKEQELDRRFAHEHIDAATLEALTAEIAALQGRLRATHLAAHLEMKRLLTPAQVRRYDALRGYDKAAPATTPPHTHDHGLR
ncbi:MAG TPA: Spy/CpxP family protein refolding chaperone [Pyrinomonadaceae bacterium]|nr:Spy/CpxP family protein refolding chaperone [Pyrinomonadaceae bacterium]